MRIVSGGLLLLLSFISSAQQSSLTLERAVCLKRGQITHGTLLSPINIEKENSEPLDDGGCAENAILLKPGVLVDGLLVSSKGYCLTDGVLLVGMAQSIGDPVEIGDELPSGKECSISAGFGIGVSLDKGVILDILAENTPAKQVFNKLDKPLLNNLVYTTTTLKDNVCIDGGIIIDGLIRIKDSTTSNEECPQSAARIHIGVVDSTKNKMFTSPDQCLVNGIVGFGRVLANGLIVKLGETLRSGKTCSLEGFDVATASGVVLRPGVLVLVPDKAITTTETTTTKTEDIKNEAITKTDESVNESNDLNAKIDVAVAQKDPKKSKSKKDKPKKGSCNKYKKGRKNDGLSRTKVKEQESTSSKEQ